MGGCPNAGLGTLPATPTSEDSADLQTEHSTEFYRRQARLAGRNNWQFNLHCIGFQSFRIRVLHNLVLSNGGNILTYKSISDTQQLMENLIMGVTRTGYRRNASFEVRCSPGIKISHIIGPAAGGNTSDDEGSLDRCVISAPQEEFTYTLFYLIDDILVQDHVYFQFVVRFFDKLGQQ